jgi:hypothetical protein
MDAPMKLENTSVCFIVSVESVMDIPTKIILSPLIEPEILGKLVNVEFASSIFRERSSTFVPASTISSSFPLLAVLVKIPRIRHEERAGIMV